MGLHQSDERRATSGERQRRPGSFITKAAAAIAGGALLASGWLQLGWIVPGWVAALVLLALTRAQRPRSALLWCWLLGLVGHVVAFYWVPDTITRYSKLPGWLAEAAFMTGCASGALQFGVFGWLACWLRQRGRASPVVVAAAWSAFELLWPSVFPWRLGQAQIEWTSLVQIAEITGVYGIGFVMVWLIEAALSLLERRWFGGVAAAAWPAQRQAALAVAVAAAVLLFGLWRERDLRSLLEERPPLRVGLVQCGDKNRMANLQRLSQDIGAQLDLLCWPESSMPSMKDEPQQLLERLRPYPDRGCHLLAGCSIRSTGQSADGRWFNCAILVNPAEQIIGRYDKRALIPFGEYVPGETWFLALHDLTVFEQRYRAGVTAEPLAIPAPAGQSGNRARLGILICYEDLIAGLARASTAAGADLLVNLTNDRWFGDSHALPQHQQLARFRAIENRRYLLRCTMTGSTSVIDPLGCVVAQAPLQEPATIVYTVATLELRTFYTAWGDVFGWGCVAAMVLAVISARKSAGAAEVVPRMAAGGSLPDLLGPHTGTPS